MKRFLPLFLLGTLSLLADGEPNLRIDFSEVDHLSFKPQLIDRQSSCCQEVIGQANLAWDTGEGNALRWVNGSSGILLEIIYRQSLPTGFSEEFKAHFHEEKRLGHPIYSYTLIGESTQELSAFPTQIEYALGEPRVVKLSHLPQECLLEELAEELAQAKAIFYSGAGLSAAADIPTIHGLKGQFFIDDGISFNAWIKLIASKDPKVLEARANDFFTRCQLASPTPAHLGLKEIIQRLGSPLFTENMDQLHEKSGICPNRISPTLLNAPEPMAAILNFDLVVCIGLSYDHRGFLSWYKALNPNGKIIAINLEAPPYLGDEDRWLKGDAQEIIPQLLDRVEAFLELN